MRSLNKHRRCDDTPTQPIASHRLQFNAGHLLDKRCVTLSRGSGDYRTYRFTYPLSR